MQLSLQEGRALKEDGLESVSANNKAFLALMRAEARRLSEQRGWVSIDDLRVYASQLNIEPTHCNAYGAIFKGPRWQVVGRRKSAVPSSHAREIRLWVYKAQSGT
jgi:hypothetical protein